MSNLKKVKFLLMIICLIAIVFMFPNFSNASSSEPNGKLTTHNRTYTYKDENGNTKTGSQSYLICTNSKGPKCQSSTNWEFHINLTNFKVYVYHKESGIWKLYSTQDCAAGRIHDHSGLSITASCVTRISRIEYRNSTEFSSFYYCLWTPTNYAMHSVLYNKDAQEPKGDYTFGKGRYVSGACVRMNTDFVKKLYKEQGKKLVGSRVIAYYTKDCFLFNKANKKAEWTVINNKKYYFKKDGYLASGPTKIGNTIYYFDLDGTYTTTTGIELRNHKYYFVKKGIVQTGWQTYNNKTYYLSKKNYVASRGWEEINDKDYYFNSKGELQKGWFTINKVKYYSSPKTGVLQDGWKKINNKTYYFWKKKGTNLDEDHKEYQMATGLISLNGKLYYLTNSGVRSTGLKTIDQNKYYFDSKTGEAISGFKTVSNKTYYFSKTDFKAVKGLQKINNSIYYFNKNGVRQTGWKTINNKKYYFRSNGKAYVNVTKKINNKKYKFDKNGIVV